MVAAAAGVGQQRGSGADGRAARLAELTVESPRTSSDWYLRAHMLYSNTPVGDGVNYGYRPGPAAGAGVLIRSPRVRLRRRGPGLAPEPVDHRAQQQCDRTRDKVSDAGAGQTAARQKLGGNGPEKRDGGKE